MTKQTSLAKQTKAPDPIPLSVPNLAGREGAYLKDCIETGWVSTAGPYVSKFEDRIVDAMGGGHAVAVVSGSAALHLVTLLAGVEPGDEVIVPSITFMATCGCLRQVGAFPVIVDIEPDHWQIDPDAVERFLTHRCKRTASGALVNKVTGRTVKALMPVHILGHPCDMDRLHDIAERFGIALIEDAAEAVGTLYRGRPVGTRGIAGALSFNGNKIATTGGGGAFVTRDAALAERALYLATQAKDDGVRYVHKSLGFNYRMTSIAAAVGCAQLERLDGFVTRKREVAALYQRLTADLPGLSTMTEAEWARSTWWLYTVRIDPKRFGADREQVMAALSRASIQSRPLWEPMHRSAALADCFADTIRVADDIHAEALSLPCSTNITDADVERVVAVLREVHASRRGR